MKRHRHSLWIFFNSVQQLDSGRTRQAWQMSLQPMVQLYKRNVSGESGEQNNLHFGDHWSIKSSFCGYPTKPCESCKFFGGRGWAFFLQSLQLSRCSSWWFGPRRPNVSFCLFLVEVPEPSEPDVEINGTCWLPHYKQHVRQPGQIVTQKTMANCDTQTKLKWIQRFPLVGYLPHRLQLWDISLPSSHHRGHLHPYIHSPLKVPWKQLSFTSIHI